MMSASVFSLISSSKGFRGFNTATGFGMCFNFWVVEGCFWDIR